MPEDIDATKFSEHRIIVIPYQDNHISAKQKLREKSLFGVVKNRIEQIMTKDKVGDIFR